MLSVTSETTEKFKNFPFKDRQEESRRVRTKYPDRVPVIVEKIDKSAIPVLTKKKYLVPGDYTVGQFNYVIREKLNKESVKLSPGQAIFLFVNGSIPPTAASFNQIYDQHKDKDGFLYLSYSSENTFGEEGNFLKGQKQSVLKFLQLA